MTPEGRPEFSIYNTQGIRGSTSIENPLGHLRGNPEIGWQAQRNLLKPLNHLDFLAAKEKTARELQLHNVLTAPDTFDENYRMLAEHQSGQLTTDEVIHSLSQQTRMDTTAIRQTLSDYAEVTHMEFHPSDVCNLTCQGCTYGHDNPETKPLPINFPYHAIERMSRLKPKSMVIIGGGEPTLYASSGKRFQGLVDKIDEEMPDIDLALVTNGTHKPEGDWPDRFSWVRLSLDAASPETYQAFRGKPTFQNVVNNFLGYLDHDVKFVGISFLYAKPNVHEYAQVAKFIYELVKDKKPDKLDKVNIQYRPLRHDPRDYNRPFTLAIDHDQLDTAVAEVSELARTSPDMERFLREQTNITAILGGNTHPPQDFDRCYYSQTFKIVRANGDIRPCFIRVTEPDFVLGNIITDKPETIGLNTLFVGARRKPDCDPQGCRQCHVNHIFQEGLKGNIQPSTSEDVKNDPMY